MEKTKWLDQALTSEERADALLAKLSLEEKMAQVVGVFAIPGIEERMEAFLKYGIGQVSLLEMRRLESLEEAALWQKKLQEIVIRKSPHQIPAIFHMEGLCGAYIHGAVSFPSGIARGASFDPELEHRVGRIVSRQERAVGITQILAPVLDISRDPRMGRQGETYGEDPALAAAMGSAFVQGIQETDDAWVRDDRQNEDISDAGKGFGRRADATAKHFLGFHHSQGGIHGADAEVPARLLREIYGRPFQAAITEAGLKGVMPCYCSIDGQAVSSSKQILTGLLRDEMGFDGCAVSDYGAVGNIRKVQGQYETLEQAGYESMRAGMDTELPMAEGFCSELLELFRDGSADIDVLNQAVRRVLTAKFRMGLFEDPFALSGEDLKARFDDREDYSVTRRCALESMVLLKNDGILPIREPVRKIAVIGPHAVNARLFFGGYTHLSMMEAVLSAEGSMAGVSKGDNDHEDYVHIPGTAIQSDETPEFDTILKKQKHGCKNLLEELREKFPVSIIEWAYGYPVAGTDQSHYEEALSVMQGADLIVFTLGGKYSSGSISTTGEGVDSANINLPPCQDGLIECAAELGRPMIGIHFDGRPVSSNTADRYLNAILEAWNPAECGAQAIVETLTGENNPSGKLPVCVAYHAGQIPVFYNHPMGSSWHQGESIGFQTYADLPHKPRYPFGYGLSYTTFSCQNLVIDKKEIDPDEKLAISIEVTNTGSCAGTEVMQLYLHDRCASMVRPCRELAGFARITLKAGETGSVVFTIDPSITAFLDEDMRWKIEKGDVDILIGTSSEDIHQTGTFRIRRDLWIDGKYRMFYAKAKTRELA